LGEEGVGWGGDEKWAREKRAAPPKASGIVCRLLGVKGIEEIILVEE
jgi:hypothetical protein